MKGLLIKNTRASRWFGRARERSLEDLKIAVACGISRINVGFSLQVQVLRNKRYMCMTVMMAIASTNLKNIPSG